MNGRRAALLLLGLALAAPPALRAEVVRTARRPVQRLLPPYRPGEVIVRFETAAELSVVERAVRDVGGREARPSRSGGHWLVSLAPGASVPEALARFKAMREVEYAEPNGYMRAL